jgi:Membrane bound O-acyl transferase family
MNAYLPIGDAILIAVTALLATVVAGGFFLNRFGSRNVFRLVAWTLTAAALVTVERLAAAEPSGFRMLAIIAVLLYGMKAVVAVESRLSGKPPLPLVNWLVFCLLWFGMRPAIFLKLFRAPRPGAASLLASGLLQMAIGGGFIAAAVWTAPVSPSFQPQTLACLALLMVGLSFLVHFGLFDVLAGVLRSLGADCPKLFRAPFLSRTLTEFWGRRWNIAFSEMAALAVFRPTKRTLGPTAAKTAAFLFSGLLHELAISVPVQAGYGLPFCYFLLHAVAMHLETTAPVRRALQSRAVAHCWTAAWILLPLPLLFHWPFCAGVLLPLLCALTGHNLPWEFFTSTTP